MKDKIEFSSKEKDKNFFSKEIVEEVKKKHKDKKGNNNGR